LHQVESLGMLNVIVIAVPEQVTVPDHESFAFASVFE